ncbi:uncharacterized protein LOC134192532 isoform X1 [Corticium candelabrum]|uniref:uncharacterized protein LOC134192532 isoform X1 n=1 Tax=Corticium candelabrum TaxID=121492 RepID=UPI002E25AA04|nr:uncharacterized protein LOC134192532 isoform X1 [Corticium candelabrum]
MESRSASKRVRAPVADPGMLDLEHVDFDGEGEEESLLAMTSAMTTLIGTMRYSVKLMPRLLFWRRKSPIRRRTSSRINIKDCHCGSAMNIQKYSRGTDGYIWRCPKHNCKATRSVRTGSFFSNSNITLTKYMVIILH